MHPDYGCNDEAEREVQHLMPQAREQLIAEDAAEGFPFEEPSVRAVERRAVKLARAQA